MMTCPLITTRPPRRYRTGGTPSDRRHAEDAFLERHDGWGARALERPFAPDGHRRGDGS